MRCGTRGLVGGAGDFASDYGYDVDSMSAHRTWLACRVARDKFRRLFHDSREPAWVLEMLDHEGID